MHPNRPSETISVPVDSDNDDSVITVARWGSGPVEIILLHDGLGSIAQWRSIPADLAARTGKGVLAYDRAGHGGSTPTPTGPWPPDWLHREADRFGKLLAELCKGSLDWGPIEIINPLLVGHSDGGSIALLYAAANDLRDGLRVSGVVTLAAHSWVEQRCFDAIAQMRADPGPIITGLSRAHDHPAAVFEAWSGVWVSDEFRPWDIRPLLNTVNCPTLIAQGVEDEYATSAHAVETAAAIGANAEWRLLDGVGHLLHHQDPELVVDVIAGFQKGEI